MERNDRFPGLSTIAGAAITLGKLLIGLGLVGLIIGCVLFAKGVSSGTSGPFGIRDTDVEAQLTGGLLFGTGVLGGVFGVILLIFGEGVGVMFAIEQNTRGSAQYLGERPRPEMQSVESPDTDSSEPTPVPASMMRRADDGET
ncbi:MAG: hypothetical protein O3A46_15040 [Candidatus Poribacteria bacterium]|nr:hypothetical protein [Candidatus Poribacteria bacterium]